MFHSFETPQTNDPFERLSESQRLKISEELIEPADSNLSREEKLKKGHEKFAQLSRREQRKIIEKTSGLSSIDKKFRKEIEQEDSNLRKTDRYD